MFRKMFYDLVVDLKHYFSNYGYLSIIFLRNMHKFINMFSKCGCHEKCLFPL